MLPIGTRSVGVHHNPTEATDSARAAIERLGFRTQEMIGSGATATVFHAQHTRSALLAAVKIIHKERLSNDEWLQFCREPHILTGLRHPNICRIYDAFETPRSLYLIMQLGPDGDLEKYVGDHVYGLGEPISPDAVRNILRQVASGLQHAHERNIVHRDLKPQNVVLDGGTALITDWGLGTNTQPDGLFERSNTGTYSWIPPELIMQDDDDAHYDAKAGDAFGLGGIGYYLMSAGNEVWRGHNAVQIVEMIRRGEPVDPYPLRRYPENLRAPVMALLHRDPTQRPSVTRFLAAMDG